MASNLKSVADVFERKLFRIPDYQRGFSWEDKQLQDFWDDLDRLTDNRIHYTGLLTLEKANLEDDYYANNWKADKWLIDSSGYEPYFVVDGQQRLTTIIILLQCILNKIEENGIINYNKKDVLIEKYIRKQAGDLKSYIFDYTHNDPSSNFLKREIFSDSLVEFNSPMTVYTRNIENAENFFIERLKDAQIGELEKIFRKVTLKLQFNVYDIEDELDVFVTFETTNNRGKALSKLELLKNRLIFLTTILPNENTPDKKGIFEEQRKDLRTSINQAWKTIYEYLGKNKDNQLDDDEFLMNHYYMYFGYKTDEAADFSDILLNEKFTSKKAQNGDIGIQDVSNYVNSLKHSIIQWFRINNPYHDSSKLQPEIAFWVAKLNRIKYASFFPCLMAAFQIKDLEDNSLLELLRAMERYIFLVFRISQRRSNTGRNLFYARANDLFSNKKNIYDLTNEIQLRTNDSNIGHDASLKRFSEYIKELFQSEDENSIGYSDWEGIRYFLYEYELYLQDNNDNKVTWEFFNRANTIEHVYPQNPKDTCWEIAFKSYNIEKRRILLHSLGNLLLLSKRKNSQQQNYCFDYKKKHEARGNKDNFEGYFNGSYSEIEISQLSSWSAKEIFDRGIKLLTFMEKRWNISIGDMNRKRALLQLEFINY